LHRIGAGRRPGDRRGFIAHKSSFLER
jgi:hypothetical protein